LEVEKDMSGDKDFSFEDLVSLIKNRGQAVLRKFGQIAVSDVSDPKLLSVLRCVKAYWPDTFRPAFTSFCCEAVGGQPEAADDVSLMITLTSSGGGIHDDIIDKSLHKHCRMTILGLHGLDYALLAGDLLIIKGWAMARELFKNGYNPEKLAKIVEVFGKWTIDVCEAEFMEISCRRNLNTGLDHYQKILRRSMADIEGCAKLGAVVGGGSEKEIEALAEFGSCLGFAFRLEDDVKDAFNEEFNLADRLKNESVPLPILYAAKSSEDKYFQIKSVLGKTSIDPLDIKQLKEICFETGAFRYILMTAKKNEKVALKKLNLLKPSSARNTLRLMIEKSFADVSKLCL
jgi:geranylgeranyl pyrophosphate synthase